MKYHHIKNLFFDSNTFIIENKNKDIVIIDPGNPDIRPIMRLINKNKWLIKGVILTHEHADHIAGLSELYKFKKFSIYCSEITSINIANSKSNFSKYIDEIKTFELDVPTQVLSDNESFNIGDGKFFFIETPGHSPGSACVFTKDAVFTGDTILNQKKPPLNFPHSNKTHYLMSLKKIKKKIKSGMIIFPGHGEPFKYKDKQ